MLLSFKQKVAHALRAEGYSVQQEKMSAAYLKYYNFNVNTIIDVGVYKGSPFFYDAFPNANIILVDPLKEAQLVYQQLKNTRNIEIFRCIASNNEGEALFSVADNGSMSSVEGRTSLTQTDILIQKTVTKKTLDTICEETCFSGPYGIKIDTEGHELQVVEGITNNSNKCEFFIMEVSIRDRFIGGYRFSNLIALIRHLGFELIDVLSSSALPRFVDCLFVKADSDLFSKDLMGQEDR